MLELSETEVYDMIDGATILGTGGGGDPEPSYQNLKVLFEQGKKAVVAELSDLNSQDYVASPYFVGSIAPTERPMKGLKFDYRLIGRALELTKEILKFNIKAFITSEIGGGNTGLALIASMVAGIPLINADFMGRAGPELHQSSVNIMGNKMSPSIIITHDGNEIIVMNYASIDSYEHLARYSSIISGGSAAVLDSIMKKDEADKVSIHGTIQRCINIGKARREALYKGVNPVDAILRHLINGKIIFKGVINTYEWKDVDGFLKGEVTLIGEDEYTGSKYEGLIINEHISAKIDGEYKILPPDLIIFLNPKDGGAVSNTVLKRGIHIWVVAGDSDDVWKTPKGLELFGPAHFGIKK